MKDLVDRDKLDAMLDKETLRPDAKTDRRGCAVLTIGHIKTLLILCKLDPADLDKMNLVAVRVLGELKKHIARGKKNCDRANEPCVYSLYAVIENLIRDLESAADLKVPEILVQARAWKRMLLHTQHNNMAQTEFEMHQHLKEARDELALPSSGRATEKGEEAMIKDFGIRFGGCAPNLIEQLESQDIFVKGQRRVAIEVLQEDADALTRLHLRGVLPDGVVKPGRKKLIKSITLVLKKPEEKDEP